MEEPALAGTDVGKAPLGKGAGGGGGGLVSAMQKNR